MDVLVDTPSVETCASIERGNLGTLTTTPEAGTSKFALSSTARLSRLMLPDVEGIHVYDQLPLPDAGCQVCPASVDTSTPATTPPPKSVAVPLIVTGTPNCTVEPLAGEFMVEAGG